MSSSKPVLSIIIPTRNRARYAISAIRSVLSYPANDFELIVQDNSSDRELEAALCELRQDERLVYRISPEPMDVIANFSAGLELSRGEYVTFFGDDDGANPEIVDVARWAAENSIEVVVTTRPSEFAWPDKRFRYFEDRLSGRLDIRDFSGSVRNVEPERELLRCLRSGGVLSAAIMPNAYRGIVQRDCFDRVRSKIGTCFPGPSPDLSMAIALSTVVKRMVQVDYPVFVPGASLGNVHALGRADYAELELEKKGHLPKNFVAEWSDLVPRFFSGPTVWGETAVQAIRKVGRQELLTEFGVCRLHARCAVFYPRLGWPIVKHLFASRKMSFITSLWEVIRFVTFFLLVWLERFRTALWNVRMALFPGFRNSSFKADTIEESVHTLGDHLKSRNYSFRQLVTADNRC